MQELSRTWDDGSTSRLDDVYKTNEHEIGIEGVAPSSNQGRILATKYYAIVLLLLLLLLQDDSPKG